MAIKISNTTVIDDTRNFIGVGLSVSGISTISSGPLLVGTATSTGTLGQDLQVVGGAYISGSVGVGTTNPTQPFQVGTSSTNVVVIDSSGELGIGVTNPTQKLHVDGSVLLTGAIYANTDPGTAGQVLKSTGTGVEWGTAAASADFAETVGLLGL